MTNTGRWIEVEGGLKFNQDYAYCGSSGKDHHACGLSYDQPVAELTAIYKAAAPEKMQQDHNWLREQLNRITSFPGMEFTIVAKPTEPIEHVMFVVTIPMPDAYNPESVHDYSKWFRTGRINFSLGAARRDFDLLVAEVVETIRHLANHEIDEFTMVDGERLVDPHPALVGVS
jgi:hypothetical protein